MNVTLTLIEGFGNKFYIINLITVLTDLAHTVVKRLCACASCINKHGESACNVHLYTKIIIILYVVKC